MNIAVNTRLLLPQKREGLGRFAHEVLSRVTVQHPEHTFVFIFDRPYANEFVYSRNVVPVVVHPQARHPVLWYLFFDWGIPPILKKYKADLFFSPDGWLSLRTRVPSLPVIHDLNFFHNPEWIEWAPMRYYNYFFPRFLKKATRIATVSEYSKDDIVQRFRVGPEKVDVVFNGTSEGFIPIREEQRTVVRDKYSAGKPFFLFVGLVHPRKNLKRVIEAFVKFKKQASSPEKLLIVGSTKYMTNDVRHAYENSGIKDDIFFLGRVPDKELKKLTASALAQIYVSLFEGFGIPILEAMSCRTPVITSEITSMPEVGGEAAVYVDPYSVDAIAEAMLKISNDKGLRSALIEKAGDQLHKYSWDKTAGLIWESIQRTLGHNHL